MAYATRVCIAERNGCAAKCSFHSRGVSSTPRGACQATCRFDYAALRLILASSSAVLTSESRSGLSVTTSMGCQLHVCRDQRRGWAARASVYSAWRLDRMSRSSPAKRKTKQTKQNPQNKKTKKNQTTKTTTQQRAASR